MVIYEYEDHTYPTQKRVKEVLRDNVCSPGKHKWRTEIEGVLDVCTCGLMRWNK